MVVPLALIFLYLLHTIDSQFSINYTADSFYMDGKPFQYVSGSIHYFRIPRQYWRDRLHKVRAAGLNAISTYVEWSLHEKKPGDYDFTGSLDLEYFIKLAQEEKLYVILRPGPYICAEVDMGGLPYWLLSRHPNMYLRTSDDDYKHYVQKWLQFLMHKISPLLYGKGGPIIMVQVENEYGSYVACDYNYSIWLRDLYKKYVGQDAVLFTTDGVSPRLLECGKIPEVYATIDFGPFTDVNEAIKVHRIYEPKGPLVNSEYYTGWLTHWGEPMAQTNTSDVVRTLRVMLELGMNVNLYMFHGGTNFGFLAGANFDKKYTPDITSYDYDAPISEAGDLTEKYFEIRNLIHQFFPPEENLPVVNSEKGHYGEVELTAVASFLSPIFKTFFGVQYQSSYPLSFEKLYQNSGYLLYETEINIDAYEACLRIPVLRDLANVYVNGIYQGTLSRENLLNKLMLKNIQMGDRLSIAVENLGRINYGRYLNDMKGILSDVYMDSNRIQTWEITGFELNNIEKLENCYLENGIGLDCFNGKGYTFYKGIFYARSKRGREYPSDTYLNVTNLMKGLVFVNNFNLGRYWSTRGPQYTLYVPGVYLKPYPQENVLIIMEEYISSPKIRVRFSKDPIFKY